MKKGKAEESKAITGRAQLALDFPSRKSAEAAYHALLQEADFSHRGSSKVFLEGKSVKISINSDDPVSLRASINSYLRLMHIIKTIEQEIDNEDGG